MIIGIVGFIGAGKGSVGDILCDRHFYHKFAFADPLKDAVSVIFNWPRQLLEGDTEGSRAFRERIDPWWSNKFGYEVTPRLILQLMGTEACRKGIHDSIWISSLERRIVGYDNVVITDVRFPNEIEFIRKVGGKIIRVKRGDNPVWWDYALLENTARNVPVDTMSKSFANIHPSEWKWIGSPVDYTIHNEGTLTDLKKSVSTMLTELGETNTVSN